MASLNTITKCIFNVIYISRFHTHFWLAAVSSGGMGTPLFIYAQTHTHHILDMIAIIGTSDQPCWLAEACKILLLLLPLRNTHIALCQHAAIKRIVACFHALFTKPKPSTRPSKSTTATPPMGRTLKFHTSELAIQHWKSGLATSFYPSHLLRIFLLADYTHVEVHSHPACRLAK